MPHCPECEKNLRTNIIVRTSKIKTKTPIFHLIYENLLYLCPKIYVPGLSTHIFKLFINLNKDNIFKFSSIYFSLFINFKRLIRHSITFQILQSTLTYSKKIILSAKFNFFKLSKQNHYL